MLIQAEQNRPVVIRLGSNVEHNLLQIAGNPTEIQKEILVLLKLTYAHIFIHSNQTALNTLTLMLQL